MALPLFLRVHVFLNFCPGWRLVPSGIVSPIKTKEKSWANDGISGVDVDVGDGRGIVVGPTVGGKEVAVGEGVEIAKIAVAGGCVLTNRVEVHPERMIITIAHSV